MEAPICALVDAMFTLPAKLDRLLVRHSHLLPRGAEDEIPLIKQDLEKMISILQEPGDSGGAEDHAMMVNCLIKEVRELSYDMEDSVDQYEHAANTSRWILSPRRKKYKLARRNGKTTRRLPEKLKWRLWMANKIREFSVRSQEALQRWYSLFNHPGGNGINSSTASTSTRCDLSFGSWHPTPPVGIDSPLKKLVALLDKDVEQKLKVVSILGSGGIGKTTLANELYRRIGWQFECRAFVRTSRKPDVRRILISMLSQLRPHQTPQTWKVHSLIADIRAHLQDKRYLIVIDDIWDVLTWDIINRALPDGNLCSGILITTEVEDVALRCCGYDSKYVYTMKPLGHDDSRKLFFNTAFGPKYECPSELSEVANSIIQKCAGLPLAMVIVANIFVSHRSKPEQWDYLNKSLGYGLRTNLNSEGMEQVLNLSYSSLPEHLKPCVMYLSIYEEDYIIQKDDMVKQWLSEGFICATEEKDKEEISRSYFDELISSRMIQPVHVNDNDDVLSCSVHYMVLDFVRHKSIEENFVTAIDHCQTTARLADNVRRLSLHFGNAEAKSPTNMGLSQVRTLAFYGVFKCLPSIMEFGLLQVLILHLWGDDESISFDLTGISELFRLRYFHVTSNVTLELPKTQMRGLEYLETLKIDARVSAVPSDIVHLPGLLHLSLPAETNLPNGIARMTSLCTLGYFDLSVNSIESAQSIGELTNIQDLRLTCSTVPSCHLKSKIDIMCSVIAKLSDLRSLTLEPSSILEFGSSNMSISCEGFSSMSSPTAFLRRFEWLPQICTFSSLPKWIGHLGKICILKIGITELVRNDVDVLRGLPSLAVLSLYVRKNPAERIVFNKTGFSVLKYFNFQCSIPWLEFQVDAMPNLQNLKLGFNALGRDQHGIIPVGIEHLSSLKEISARIGGSGTDDPDRTAVESALSYAFKFHPACPTFNIQRVDLMFTGKDDNIGGVQEKQRMTLQKQCEIMEEVSIEHHEVLRKYSRKDAHSWFSALSESNTGPDKQAVHRFSAFSEWRTSADKHADSSTRPQCRIDDMDGLSSSRRWSTLLKKYALKEEGRNMQTQYGIMEEDSNKEHGVLKKDYMEDTEKNVHGGKMLPKWSTQVRLSSWQDISSSLQDIKELDDGFSWMKYGQKDIPGSKYPRGYYRCKHRFTHGCQAMKQLQRTDGNPWLFNAMYVGNHICTQVANSLSRFGHEQSSVSVSGEVKAERSAQGTEHMPWRTRKLSTQTRRMQVRVEFLDTRVPDDGLSWRKYGEKDIVGSRFPRYYLRCTHRNSRGCAATKQVQRTDIDLLLFDVVYHGEHTCGQNAQSSVLQYLGDSISAAGSKDPPTTSESQITYGGEMSGSTAGIQFMSPAMSMSGSQVNSEAISGIGSTAGVGFMSPGPGPSNSQITSDAASGSGSITQFWSGALDEVDSTRDDDMPDPDCDDLDLNLTLDTDLNLTSTREI